MHLSPRRPAPGGLAVSLAALGLAALAPTAARAQSQDLFVSNNNNTISRFAGTGPGTFATTATMLTGGGLNQPEGLAFDTLGDLFVANFSTSANTSTITEFAAGTTPGTFGAGMVVETGLNGATGLAFDKSGDLFAANGSSLGAGSNTITEFASTGPGTFGAATTLSGGGLNGPAGLAFDSQGDLFVANNNGGSNGQGSITEFASTGSGTFGAGTTLNDPSLNGPAGLAFDSQGDLFTSNLGNSITEFASTGPGTFGTVTNFTNSSLNIPDGLAFDKNGDLFVTNFSGNDVTEFISTGGGTFGAGKVVETGLNNPNSLAFGPSAPVPEASTTVSFGLLLVLGLGSLIVVAKRKKANTKG